MSRDYPKRPWVGIGVVVFHEKSVLLIKRGKPPRQGQWSLPGGAQELGETVAAAAQREVLEECGIAIEICGLIDVVDSISRDDDGAVRFHYTLVELAAIWRAGALQAASDAEAACWVPLNKLDDYKLWQQTQRIITQGVQRYIDGTAPPIQGSA